MSDNLSEANGNNSKFRPFAELLFCMSFLTRLPTPFIRTLDLPPLAQAMRFFPLAGAIIGSVAALTLLGLQWLNVPALLASTICCAMIALITGALHEDGLADSFDGLFGGNSAERRLEIMRDSRIGTYGAIALGLAFLMRIAAYQSLLSLPLWTVILVVAGCASFSRAMMVDLMWASKNARSDGLSKYAGRPTRNTALIAIFSGGALVIYAGEFLQSGIGVIAILAATAITGLIRQTAIRKINGQTGDICGAVQVLSEIAMLTVFTSTIH